MCVALLAVTFILMVGCINAPWLSYLALPSILLATWVERWLFFAEAEHVVGLFYGKQNA